MTTARYRVVVLTLLAALAAAVPGHTVPMAQAAVRYVDPVFAVDVHSDVVYGTALRADGSPMSLVLDLYTSLGDTATQRPVFAWAHGGAFFTGDKSASKDWATELAQQTCDAMRTAGLDMQRNEYAGYGQVLSCGSTPGSTSNPNTDTAGQTVAGLAFVRFDADGDACLYSPSASHLVADVQGCFGTAAFDDLTDVRLLDTRTR